MNFKNLESGKAIHLVKKPDATDRAQPRTPYDRPTTQSNEDTLQRRAQSGRTVTRLHNCRVLQRNFHECVSAAQLGKDPEARDRHNDVLVQTPDEPHLEDLGFLTKEMSETMLTWSMQLTRLGEQLVRDEPLPDRNADVYQVHRRLIQNNMDAARYLSPQLQNFSQFIVPLGEQRPRRLSVVAPQTAGAPRAAPR